MSKHTTSGVGSDKLKQLLCLGADEQEICPAEDNPDPNEQKARRLTALLKAVVPFDEVLIQTLPMIFQRVSQELGVLSAGAIEEALLDPASDMAVIERIKSYAKKTAKIAVSSIEKEAATVLYYAAIASALVFHNKWITKHSKIKLKQSFIKLSSMDWVNKKIAGLLNNAVKVCDKQIGSNQQEDNQ